MSKTLLVMRHAKSSWKDASLSDHDRPLNKRGRTAAPRMGELIRDQGILPDYIATSSALRARATAEAVADACGYSGTIRELCELVTEERADWPADVSHAFEQRLHSFDATAERHRQALASAVIHDVRARDALYDVYQAEIAFLQRAALDGPPALGAQP